MLIQRQRMLNNQPLLFNSEFMAPPAMAPRTGKTTPGI